MNIISKAGEWLRYINMHRPINHFTPNAPNAACKPKIIATLTSLPERMEHVDAAINSILNQTMNVSEIVFSLPEKSKRMRQPYRIPERFLSHPKISILRTERDYGPITKLLPVLQREWNNPNALILCFDDDIVYPSTFVSDLIAAREQLGDVALTGVGYTIPPSMRDADRQRYKRKGANIKKAQLVDILMGAGGFMVQPKMFSKEFLNTEDIPDEAFFADDLWISFNLAKNKIPCYVAPLRSINPVENLRISSSQHSLGKTENLNGSNNEKMMQRFAKHEFLVNSTAS